MSLRVTRVQPVTSSKEKNQMDSLVLGFYEPQIIGSITKVRLGVGNIETDQPFYIIREATYAEWERSATECGCNPNTLYQCGYSHFYEVSTD